MQPCDHLLQRLQFMDEEGGALFDINREETDPIRAMRASYASMVATPVNLGPLRTVFFHFEPQGIETIENITGEARRNALSVDSQVWYWLDPLKDFPFR